MWRQFLIVFGLRISWIATEIQRFAGESEFCECPLGEAYVKFAFLTLNRYRENSSFFTEILPKKGFNMEDIISEQVQDSLLFPRLMHINGWEYCPICISNCCWLIPNKQRFLMTYAGGCSHQRSSVVMWPALQLMLLSCHNRRKSTDSSYYRTSTVLKMWGLHGIITFEGCKLKCDTCFGNGSITRNRLLTKSDVSTIRLGLDLFGPAWPAPIVCLSGSALSWHLMHRQRRPSFKKICL